MHRCFAEGAESRRIAPRYQQHVCLTPAHITCPYFEAAQTPEAAIKPRVKRRRRPHSS
jgi:hypothetical protein